MTICISPDVNRHDVMSEWVSDFNNFPRHSLEAIQNDGKLFSLKIMWKLRQGGGGGRG